MHTHMHTQLMLSSATAFGENRYRQSGFQSGPCLFFLIAKKKEGGMHFGTGVNIF